MTAKPDVALARLTISDDAPTADDWDEVHRQVQDSLSTIDDEIRRRVPGVDIASGRTSGELFHLFSYRTFTPPDETVDPVVVGITFKPTENGVALEADASGEGLGDVVIALPVVETSAAERRELVTAAVRLAHQLGAEVARLSQALTDHSREVD